MSLLILIGCPSSGKSTLADHLVKQNPNYHIVSTDRARAQLFGDEAIQDNWQQVENEIFRQIAQNITVGNPIIYDATNAKRPWRMELIQKIKQLGEVNIIGLYLTTPLEVCQKWNQQRKRQVPNLAIEEYFQTLQQFPPILAEGFTAILEIPFLDGSLDLSNLERQLATVACSQTMAPIPPKIAN
jgi:predicted kinase